MAMATAHILVDDNINDVVAYCMVSGTLPSSSWQFAGLHLFSFGRSRLPKTQLKTADRHVTGTRRKRMVAVMPFCPAFPVDPTKPPATSPKVNPIKNNTHIVLSPFHIVPISLEYSSSRIIKCFDSWSMCAGLTRLKVDHLQ